MGFEPTTLCLGSPPLRGAKDALEAFIADRKGTKGLTANGEFWLRETLTRFLDCLPIPLDQVRRIHIVQFLARYEGKPWRKHAFYRALKSFWKWASMNYDIPNPMVDRWGNPTIEAPKTPTKVLYTLTPDKVKVLIEGAPTVRDKAIVSLLADTGARRSELASIEVSQLDLDRNLIKVMGKGNKEGYLIFGDSTKALLTEYIREVQPTDKLFDLDSEGLKSLLRRLERRTGIKCNAHSFRRGFATELRRQGLSELDISELGRWSSVEMVKRYTRAYTFNDAAKRYRPIVT